MQAVAMYEPVWIDGIYHILSNPVGQAPQHEGLLNYFHPDDRPKLRAAKQNTLEHGESYDSEARLIGVDGDQRWVRTVCKTVVEDARPSSSAGLFRKSQNESRSGRC